MTPARAARTVAPLPAEGLWAEAFRVQRRGGDVVAGLAGALATCGPLALGIALDEPQIGVTAALGGLNGALVTPRGPLRDRLGWGLGATLGYCASGALAMALQGSVAASVAAAFVVVVLTAYMRTFGFTGGLTGFVIGAMFVILSGIPGNRSTWVSACSGSRWERSWASCSWSPHWLATRRRRAPKRGP